MIIKITAKLLKFRKKCVIINMYNIENVVYNRIFNK